MVRSKSHENTVAHRFDFANYFPDVFARFPTPDQRALTPPGWSGRLDRRNRRRHNKFRDTDVGIVGFAQR